MLILCCLASVFYCVENAFWWHLFIITPFLFLVYLFSCMYRNFVGGFAKVFRVRNVSLVKLNSGMLAWIYLCGSVLLTWRVRVFLLFITLFRFNALNSFPFCLFPLAWTSLSYVNCHVRTCPILIVFSSLSRLITTYYFFCDSAAQIGPRPSQCWGF